MEKLKPKNLSILSLMIFYFITVILWLGYITDPKETPIIVCILPTIVVIIGTILLIFFKPILEYKIIFILKLQRNFAPETYYQFTLIDLQFINTFQVWSINITLFNVFFSILHEKPFKEINQ